ncbi:interleukin-21 receptor-like [Myripristis murdjan]|uniref:interleukin-21 receptor-like n=1 Tax=Myripristis murdjan TaxID=586833 RepID=UPI001175CAB7|nr:interleukin-21 receptor-like [Myripristis murdjan]
MKCLLLLFVLWCSSLLAGANHSGDVIDGYSCVSDYWLTISCVLNISGDPAGPNRTDYKLKFRWNFGKKPFTCPLVMMDHSYSCTVAAANNTQNPPLCFSDMDKFSIELCFESLCHTVTKAFKPAMNIQLMPPYDVVVQKTPEAFFITWKSGYENHRYIKNRLQYELLLQNPDGTEKAFTDFKNNSASIRRSGHDSGNEDYCIKVKSLPAASGYGAIWSKWSPLTCWKADTHKEQENILLILIKYVGLACVAVGVLLFLFYSPAVRMRIKTLAHTPSPAPFFQPLFQEHKGNFQEWISPQGSVILQLKTEEMIKADALIIVPKPITKDEAEDQDLQDSLLTQMMFTQCQSSYVGLPGMNGTPLHVNVNCLEDTPYTQLPFSGPQFGFGKAVAVSVPPENVLDISCADSGCGCEDPSQSPECSQPNSPLHSSPPQFLCTDYCVLNKTAAGIIPILISQASSVNVAPESLQKDES